MSDRPLTTLDFDGVICDPLFSKNLGIHRTFLDPDAAPPIAKVPPRWFSLPADYLRFNFRRPLAEARAALEVLHGLRTVVILTGRRTAPEAWLRRHRLLEFIDRIVINDTTLASPHFKLRLIEELGSTEHVDDDGRTAQLLAQRSSARVYLRDWPGNRDLDFAPGVTRVGSLGAFARLVGDDAAARGSGPPPIG